ncbi:DNA mismatch repair protein MutS [Blattabacterium cuenoti]|uniref:DNA mismatch repair protein MutS n=1 Tax=Blattabacterium cuenoti TaxID=1653831 RepID=UPI00163BE10E|nr:DNA mismatch repair protein MutS [Blattabacterium cuenoti]
MNKNDNNKKEETPLIKQYNNIKNKYPNAILLFQVGDFYETFGKDAIICSNILNIILTKRSKYITHLAGFPCHSLNNYLPKLIRNGYRVAICNQLEEHNNNKNIVKRGVVELITPGINIDDNLLESKSNNFLASIHMEKNIFGLSFLDISTGEFFIVEDNEKNIFQYIKNFQPNEIIFQKKQRFFFEKLLKHIIYSKFLMNDWLFNYQFSYEKLISHFKTNSLKGFGINDMKVGIISAGSILSYVHDSHHINIQHISTIHRIEKKNFIHIDDYTFKNLEIFKPLNKNGKSLLDIIDNTITPMGGRLLKNWILFPLTNIDHINDRLFSVKELCIYNDIRMFIINKLKSIRDIDRIISRIVMGKTNPKEILVLDKSINSIEKLKKIKLPEKIKKIKSIINLIQDCSYIHIYINDIIDINSNYKINKGKDFFIKEGVSKKLDNFRKLYFFQKEHLENLCIKEQSKIGIKKIKVVYNNTFGYLFEINKKYKKKIPSYWIQKQILSNSIRYSSKELINYESNIINAEKNIFIIEKFIFKNLIKNILTYIKKIQNNSKIISELDILCSFSLSALENNYSMPFISKSNKLDIINGRHPVIERNFFLKNCYIPNNIKLNKNNQQIIIITGPNMSGKSAILRQTAIIILMSHIGSFIPADKNTKIGIIDKIFSRIGSSDNISLGESTFMVEMNETSNILNNITKNSFIILDEIGRGTSTNDGISIAQSIIEFLHESKLKPFTLFATHYHELNNIYLSLERVKNYHISVKKYNNKIIFIRTLKPGVTSHSLGIHVAKMSGMPKKIIDRANTILKKITKNSNTIKKVFSYIKDIKDINSLYSKNIAIKIIKIILNK